MNLLGKVFTGLIFLLSVIFFSLAIAVNASHINQKALAAKFQGEAKKASDINTQLNAQLEAAKDNLALEQASRRSSLATLQTQLEEMSAELQSKVIELRNVQTAHSTLVGTEKETQQELKARTAENEALRKQLVDAREDRNQTFQRLVATKDELNRLQGIYQALRERERLMAADLTRATEKLEIIGIRPETLLTAPEVNGQVTAVATNGLVEVSLGRDDGMREGFTLEAHRNGQYLGRLLVKTVSDNKSVAEIITGYQQGYIREGDRVDSKLY